MNRKDEHVSLAKAFHKDRPSDFDHVHLIHRSFPQVAVDDISITSEMASLPLKTPFFINAMTGGSEKTKQINEQLATLARETSLAMATGSVSIALKDPSVQDSFTIVRKTNPTGMILANVGAGSSLEQAQRAIDLLEANALQIHVNAPQELVMPEGDRDFRYWLEDIAKIASTLSIPVIVKEVGFGMTRETIQQLIDCGITSIDVSGQGGTSFTQIENARRKNREFGYLDSYGLSTVQSLLEANEVPYPYEFIASGGIRQAYDIFKALALGANAVGISGTILTHLLTKGLDETILLVQQWQSELTTLYAMTGSKTTAQTRTVPLYFTGSVREWCDARRIAPDSYSFRTN
ncbi:type 2 isopentenyl-diphosphate Delta-isomerase [Enterococcus italicus]|jgi:isopentenyl-diphosphate delta-isomerase|uniref:Isopentenyl-diphosphate delta-isomerase n=1 Tax=Enterococcus italicus (strain DSM 15952 / CCUG 50447 / LMG 22039 / TP 1.5) TaxID=888064 RepID=E6LIC4_ENTI1|nr:type 2 isopentenyl-diphosphate Delta-isomerase [Enterococcus italicus]EFU72999.1 isopentenyl-diphosphate delta-isomerase, type 2 [Enterococcus italicus DSM 15952]